MSKVSIVKTDGDFHAAFIKALGDIRELPIGRGDRVLIKPNLYEPLDPYGGEITNPMVVEAVARYCLESGAREVIIGEGPSYYQSQSALRDCFTRTGISGVAERLGIQWVLFDEHRYRTFKGVPDSTPEEFRITEYAFACDKIINVPCLKTHYQTTVTLAMKNLKGCLKREDKPRFHDCNLSRAIVELNKIVRPALNVIDATAKRIGSVGSSARREGTGASLLLVSTDAVAVDAVGCALMGIDPGEVPTVTSGAEAGLGESDLTRIEIIGEELKRLRYKVRLPQEQLRQSFPLLEIKGAERACSGCLIPLISSLLLLSEGNRKLERPLRIWVGKDPEVSPDKACLLIGDCAQVTGAENAEWLEGCPPEREKLLARLERFIA
jgi:uncharacterized protein (DUF362 family)